MIGKLLTHERLGLKIFVTDIQSDHAGTLFICGPHIELAQGDVGNPVPLFDPDYSPVMLRPNDYYSLRNLEPNEIVAVALAYNSLESVTAGEMPKTRFNSR